MKLAPDRKWASASEGAPGSGGHCHRRWSGKVGGVVDNSATIENGAGVIGSVPSLTQGRKVYYPFLI